MVATVRSAELPGLDDQPAAAAVAALRAVCSADRWIAAVLAGRPHGDLARLTAASDAALADLDWPDVEQALSGHPRIGDRAAGAAREAAWSRQEQSAAATEDARVRQELRAANVAYEERFGWVFLICASGRPAAAILEAARRRLGNDPATEQRVVRSELRDIVRLRLAKAFGSGRPTTLSTHVLDAATGRPASGMGVRLERREGDNWVLLASQVTDADGRVADLAAGRAADVAAGCAADLAADLGPGIHRLVFDIESWSGPDSFYPEAAVAFRVAPGTTHLHIPLLLSPFAYSTYRGS